MDIDRSDGMFGTHPLRVSGHATKGSFTLEERLFDESGRATLILDSDRLRNDAGQVIGWIAGNSAYTLWGRHVGWFENGILYHTGNHALGFLREATGYLPSRPIMRETPQMHGFGGLPGRPVLSGVPGRPGYGGWSSHSLATYFENKV